MIVKTLISSILETVRPLFIQLQDMDKNNSYHIAATKIMQRRSHILEAKCHNGC